MLTKQKFISLKEISKSLIPSMRVGKNGFGTAQLEELHKLLKKRKLVKIKILKSAMEAKDKKSYAKEIALKADAELIDLVGFTLTLYRENKRL